LSVPKKADVVVVGGGGAGLCAAIAAAEEGASVTLVSKTPVGLGTCTTYAGGGFTLAAGGVTPQEHREMTLDIGRHLNDKDLVTVLSEEGAAAIERLQSYGVPLAVRKGGASVTEAPRPLMRGEPITANLRERAGKLGVEMLSGWMVTSVLRGDDDSAEGSSIEGSSIEGSSIEGSSIEGSSIEGSSVEGSSIEGSSVEGSSVEGSASAGCSGVALVDVKTGRMASIACGAVVLACGGGGRIYSRTDNPVRTTGDGYLLGHRLGLSFRDMEFVQFYPMGFADEGFSTWMIGLHIIDSARLTDESGHEFLRDYYEEWGISSGREANLYCRDRAAIAIARRWAEGGEALLHVEDIPDEEWDMDPYLAALKRLFPRGRKPSDGPVRVAPIQHYMSGGLVIDTNGRTAVPGVFACGEVTGGVDGANRIGGNALTNVAVFGLRAGKAAAAYSQSQAVTHSQSQAVTHSRSQAVTHSRPDEPHHQPAVVGVSESTPDDISPISPRELRARIQGIADKYLGPIRTKPGLEQAIRHLEQVKPHLEDRRDDLLVALENESLWLTAKLVATAALSRTESCGVHFVTSPPS